MYLEGVLIEAKDLINSVSIVRAERVEKVEYFHIELESHDVIFAEGALSETYIDDDSRFMFHNAQEYRALYLMLWRRRCNIARRVRRTGSRSRQRDGGPHCAQASCSDAGIIYRRVAWISRLRRRPAHRRLGAKRRSSGSASLPRHLCRRPAHRTDVGEPLPRRFGTGWARQRLARLRV